MTDTALITRVILKNYKSIAACDVRLVPLTILVGPNGSGKSNFLDALRFVAEALTDGLDQAIRVRGSADDILSRAAASAGVDEFGIRLELAFAGGATGLYALTLGVKSVGSYEVRREACSVWRPDTSAAAFFEVEDGGALVGWGGISLDANLAPARVHDRLFLVNASGLPEFRPAYDVLSRMAFYNLNPARMREPQLPDPGERLAPDGANVASVLRRMDEVEPLTKRRIEDYLGSITAGVRQVNMLRVGGHETLEFQQKVAGSGAPWRFAPDRMSDGTLRALGVLAALFQARMTEKPSISLVGIEEPENALHPAAAGVLLDALMDAAETVQVMVASHSADLLDRDDLEEESLLAVALEPEGTRIGPVGRVGRAALRQRLYTAGDLLRMNQLAPDPESADGREGSPAKTPAGP